MSEMRSAWHETAGRLGELGGKVRKHYHQAHQRAAEPTPTETETHGRMQDAAQRATSTAREAFQALGTAARDPEVKSDVGQVGRSLAGAVNATTEQVSHQVREAWTRYTAGETPWPRRSRHPGPAERSDADAGPETTDHPDTGPQSRQ